MRAGEEPDFGPPADPSRFYALFPSIAVPMFLAMLEQTIVTTALPGIVSELGDAERVSWIIVSYLVATTLAAPIYGRMGDFFGRRRVLFVALAIFVVGAIGCALSYSITMLTAARVLQGFGGGGLMTLSQALIGEALPPRDRAKYQGYLATAAVSANALGPVLGGYLTQHLGWQWVFWVDVPFGMLAALLLLRLPARKYAKAEFRFDLPGLLFFATCVIATLLALEKLHHVDEESALVLGLLFVGAVSVVCLIHVERRTHTPLIPIALFGQPAIWRSDALAACHGATLVSLLTFLPIYMRVVRGDTASEIGLLLLPLTICIGIGSLITGRLVSHTGWTTRYPSVGLVVVVASLVILALGGASLSDWQLMTLFAVNALFMGTVMGVVQVTVQTAAGPAMIGAAAGSVQFSRSIGAALGTSIVSAVFFVTLTRTDSGAAHLFRTMLQAGSSAVGEFPQSHLLAIQAEVASAFRLVFLTIASFAAMALVLAWSIPLRRL